MSELLHKLTTNWGKLQVFESRIVIDKIDEVRLIGGDVKSQKIINIGEIKTVQFREPSFLRAGYIQFAVGGSEYETAENTFSFGQDKLEIAKKIKKTVERLMDTNNPKPPVALTSAADEILKLKGLADGGTITQEEFELGKRQILNL